METISTIVTFKGKRGESVAYYNVQYNNIRFVIWHDDIMAEIAEKSIKERLSKKEIKMILNDNKELKGIVLMCKRDLKSNYLAWEKNSKL